MDFYVTAAHWVVQSNLYSPRDLERVTDGLRLAGADYSLHKVVPFSHDLEPNIEPSGPVVVLGTTSLCEIARRRGWKPGCFLNENFSHEVVARHWPVLNSDGRIHRLRDVPEQPEPFFLRPVDDGKGFAGHIADWPTFQEWRQRVLDLGTEGTVSADTPVVVARQKRIQSEARVWIVDRQVITASTYKRGSLVRYECAIDADVIAFCVVQAKRWNPAPAYCMDVAVDDEGKPSVLELTTLNSAGFYAADVGAIVRAIERMLSDAQPCEKT